MAPLNELKRILDEIEERANKARPGPWIASGNTVRDWKGSHVSASHTNGGQYDHESAAFIADARTDIPLLVKALRRAEEFIKYAQKVFPEQYANWDTACLAEITAILNQGRKDKKDLGEKDA